MSDSAMVISSDEITADDLRQFVLSLGGTMVPQEAGSFVINDQEADLWMAIQNKEFMAGFYDNKTLDTWKKSLGSDMKSIIELQLDHTHLCKQLYLYVACKLGEKWNVVLDDIDDSIVNYADLVSMYKRNNQRLTIDKM
jgi:hypothetical protein